jgi:hypothetical protein
MRINVYDFAVTFRDDTLDNGSCERPTQGIREILGAHVGDNFKWW